jgi:hypothetical protein
VAPLVSTWSWVGAKPREIFSSLCHPRHLRKNKLNVKTGYLIYRRNNRLVYAQHEVTTVWISNPDGEHKYSIEFGKKSSSKFVILVNDNFVIGSLLVRWVLRFGRTEATQNRVQWLVSYLTIYWPSVAVTDITHLSCQNSHLLTNKILLEYWIGYKNLKQETMYYRPFYITPQIK